MWQNLPVLDRREYLDSQRLAYIDDNRLVVISPCLPAVCGGVFDCVGVSVEHVVVVLIKRNTQGGIVL